MSKESSSPGRPEEVAPYTRQHKLTAVFMLVITTVYLVVELAFNARLLDVVGTIEKPQKVESLEVWGRLISGVAAGLVFLGYRLRQAADRGWSPRRYLYGSAGIALVFACIMLSVFFAQKWLIDGLTFLSSAESKRTAAILLPLNKLVQTGDIRLSESALTHADYETPQGKAFLATLPLHAISSPELFQSAQGNIEKMFERYAQTMRNADDETDAYELYTKSVEHFEKLYEEVYKKADKEYQARIETDVRRAVDDAWQQYLDRMAAKRMDPNKVKRRYWGRVAEELLKMDIQVPKGWNPADRATFERVVENKARAEAERAFTKEFKEKTGLRVYVKPGFSRETFFQHIKREWVDMLEVDYGTPMVSGVSRARFDEEIRPRIIKGDVKSMMRENLAPVQAFEFGRSQYENGKQYYRALIVPPIALAFSLLGAMIHIFKVFGFAAKVFRDIQPRLYKRGLMAYFAALACIPLILANQITEQPLFEKMQSATVRKNLVTGWPVALSVRWVTQFQPYFYPINNFSRTHILGGVMFDRRIEWIEDLEEHIQKQLDAALKRRP